MVTVRENWWWNVRLSSAVTPCYCSSKLWNLLPMGAILSVQIIGHYPNIWIYCKKHIYPFVNNVHAGGFHVSVIHRSLTWITGSLTCVRDHSYACVYIHTGGLGIPTASQHNIFESEKLTSFFLCSWRNLSPTLYQLSHPVTPRDTHSSDLTLSFLIPAIADTEGFLESIYRT